MPIVLAFPDGSVALMYLSEKYLAGNRLSHETTAEAVLRLAESEQTKASKLQGAEVSVVKTSALPSDRSKRYKWRLRAEKVVVDEMIPDIIDPKQTILDQLNIAITLDQTKQAMIDYIRMKG